MNKSVDPRTVEDRDGGTVWEGKDDLVLSILYPGWRNIFTIHSRLIHPGMKFLNGLIFQVLKSAPLSIKTFGFGSFDLKTP